MVEEDYDQVEDLVDNDNDAPGGTEDPENSANIVTSGDPNALARANANLGVKGLKEKRIDNDKRTTTPYMTKYERARVLGTRVQKRRVMRLVVKGKLYGKRGRKKQRKRKSWTDETSQYERPCPG
jgi:hypothetical protein